MPVARGGIKDQVVHAGVISDIKQVQLVVDDLEALGAPCDWISIKRAKWLPFAFSRAHDACQVASRVLVGDYNFTFGAAVGAQLAAWARGDVPLLAEFCFVPLFDISVVGITLDSIELVDEDDKTLQVGSQHRVSSIVRGILHGREPDSQHLV